MVLAIDSYPKRSIDQDSALLDLSWADDEREVLGIDANTLAKELLQKDFKIAFEQMTDYRVFDPYGSDELHQVVSDYFNLESNGFGLVTGAGVTSLLHSLSAFVRNAKAVVFGPTYPDFPHWINMSGGVAVAASNLMDFKRKISSDPTTFRAVYLERPSLYSRQFEHLEAVAEICKVSSASNLTVIIDESNANYYPPSFSSASLIPMHSNLVVLRGISKAYCLGGFRIGLCLHSKHLDGFVKLLVPPLLASSASLIMCRRLLGMGDVGHSLRRRIAVRRKTCQPKLEAFLGATAFKGSLGTPYLIFENESDLNNRCAAAGIRGKLQPNWENTNGTQSRKYRICLPLSNNKFLSFQDAIQRGEAKILQA